MPLIQILVLIVVIGVMLYIVNNYVPMDSTVKSIFNTVVIVALLIWLLWWLLAVTGLLTYRVPVP